MTSAALTAGLRTVILIDAAGVPHDLQLEWKATGRYMPPVTIVDEKIAGQAGTRVRQVRHEARKYAFALWIDGDLEEQETQLRELVRMFDPARGDITLVNISAGRSGRALTCRYESGLELDETLDSGAGRDHQDALVTVTAGDPYWYALADVTASWTTDADAPVWFDPAIPKSILPILLGTSSLLSSQALENEGDVDVFPVWTITGPCASITLENTTTGRSISWAGSLDDAETLTIDAREGAKTVIRADGSSGFAQLEGRDFWPLAPGVNDVLVNLGDVTTDTTITVAWRPRYLAP